jgi:hypothetical protein
LKAWKMWYLQETFPRERLEAENTVWTNFAVSEEISKHSKSYSGGEFIEITISVADIFCPINFNDVYTTSMRTAAILLHGAVPQKTGIFYICATNAMCRRSLLFRYTVPIL